MDFHLHNICNHFLEIGNSNTNIIIILELASTKGQHKTIPERKKYSRITNGRQEKDLLLFQFNSRVNKSLVHFDDFRNFFNSQSAIEQTSNNSFFFVRFFE